MEHVHIADPSGSQQRDDDVVVPVTRPRALRGARIGLLDNGKPNAADCLSVLGAALQRRYETTHLAVTKAVASKPCPDDLLVRFRGFDATVVGVGD